MHYLVRPVLSVPYRFRRSGLRLAVAATALLMTMNLHAQFGAPPPGTQVHDPSALRPPAGARVAIVEFEDMECPDCARANPVLKQVAATYHIPWVRHDFPLPFHAWSMNASQDVLAQYTQKFAKDHGIALPFAIDPQGKLIAEVKSDYALGQRIGIEHTPTIWVVTANSKGAPFVEVVDRAKLSELIDQAIADTKGK
jgi:protein-disulfide isomerase